MTTVSPRIRPHQLHSSTATTPPAQSSSGPAPELPSGVPTDEFSRLKAAPFSASRAVRNPVHPRIPRDGAPPSASVAESATRDVRRREGILVLNGRTYGDTRPLYRSMDQKDAALTALRQDPQVFKRIAQPLSMDPDILYEGLRLSGCPEQVVYGLPHEVVQDREWLLKMAKANIWTLNLMPDAVLNDPQFLTEVAMAFPPLLDDSKFVDRRQELLDRSPALKERYETVKKACAELHIDEPMRLRNAALLDEVVRNRTQPRPQNDARPSAVIVYAKQDTDHNGSLKGHNIDELTKHYRVMFYEARTEHDFIEAVANGGKDGKAALVAIDGHGTRSSMNLGEILNSPAGEVHEENWLDLGDEAQLRAAKLDRFVEPNATILLEACSNGAGKAAQDNPTNMFARLFPGRDVYGPEQPVVVVKIQLDENGKVVGPSWTRQDHLTYKARVPPETEPVTGRG